MFQSLKGKNQGLGFEFDKSKTQKGTFTLESNETVQTDMMTLKAEFSHGYFKDVQARVLKVRYLISLIEIKTIKSFF